MSLGALITLQAAIRKLGLDGYADDTDLSVADRVDAIRDHLADETTLAEFFETHSWSCTTSYMTLLYTKLEQIFQ